MDMLDAFIAERRDRAFEYFVHDCAGLAADWVLRSTGADVLAPLRAPGHALAGRRLLPALRWVRDAGGFAAAGDRLLGPPRPGLMAQRGDVVLVRSGGRVRRVSGYSFGVCTGAHVVAPGHRALVFLPITEAVAAWRI